MFKITYTKRFVKKFRKLSDIEKSQVKNKIILILKDPRYPSLRTKKIKGIRNTFESGVNMDIRLM